MFRDKEILNQTLKLEVITARILNQIDGIDNKLDKRLEDVEQDVKHLIAEMQDFKVSCSKVEDKILEFLVQQQKTQPTFKKPSKKIKKGLHTQPPTKKFSRRNYEKISNLTI